MNTKLKKKAKNDFEKKKFNFMNHAVFQIIMENLRKQRYRACKHGSKK